MNETYWWLAINQTSCTAAAMPLPATLMARPTPEQLMGFKTREEQLEVQHFLLTAPIEHVEHFMVNVMPKKIRSGEVVYLRQSKPEPPIEHTLWMAGGAA